MLSFYLFINSFEYFLSTTVCATHCLHTGNTVVNKSGSVSVFIHSEFTPCWNTVGCGTGILGSWMLLDGRREGGKKGSQCFQLHGSHPLFLRKSQAKSSLIFEAVVSKVRTFPPLIPPLPEHLSRNPALCSWKGVLFPHSALTCLKDQLPF